MTALIMLSKNVQKTLVMLSAVLVSFSAFGQAEPKVAVPEYNDKYSEYVRKLEAGQMDIDYQDFRFSFLESQQFIIANKKASELESLEKEMRLQMQKSNYKQIIKITKQMLGIDYTSLIAHKILRQTYKIVGDTVQAAHYKTIQFGLLNSITRKGNGKTCATAWPIIQLSEEYFMLEMIDAELQKQSIDREGGLCDKMEVKIEGTKKIYYFETSKVFEGYRKLGMK